MIEDAPDLSGVSFAGDFGLGEGESLPEDHEDLTEAQYALFRFLRVLQGCADDSEAAKIAEQAADAPSKLITPRH